MPKYIIEFKKSNAKVILEYNPNGCLTYYEHSGVWDKTQFSKFFNQFPFLFEHLEVWNTAPDRWKVSEAEEDLSFQRFWDDYANKDGNKSRAIKLWDKLDELSRHSALKHIQVYDQVLLKTPGRQKLLPETYLAQTRWNL